jgi:phospholipid transport system transporter-binding protein
MSDACTIEWSGQGDARLAGPLTFSTCASVFNHLEQRGGDPLSVVRVDLSGVTEADSAGLALLLEWQSRRKAAGGELKIIHAPDLLLQLARLADATKMLNMTGKASS